MEKIKKVIAHGGARPGSGRKAKGTHGPKVRAVCVRISEEIYGELEILKDRGWSASALLEGAVEAIYNSVELGEPRDLAVYAEGKIKGSDIVQGDDGR